MSHECNGVRPCRKQVFFIETLAAQPNSPILICSYFTFSLKDSGSTADGRVLSWQAEVAGSCPVTAEAPLLKHSKCNFCFGVLKFI